MCGMFHNPGAFEPFYDERVTITSTRSDGSGARTLSVDCRACILDCGFDDAFGNGDIDSERRRLSIIIPRRGCDSWPTGDTPPRPGDVVSLPGGKRASVERVNVHQRDAYTLEAREQ